MHKLFLILAISIVLTSVSGCFDNGHSHDNGPHSHDGSPQHKDSIN